MDNFNEIEEVVDKVGNFLQAMLLEAMAEQREAEGGQRCPECGGKMQRRGKIVRRLKTSKGQVNFTRK